MAKKEGMTAGKFLERAKEMVLGWSQLEARSHLIPQGCFRRGADRTFTIHLSIWILSAQKSQLWIKKSHNNKAAILCSQEIQPLILENLSRTQRNEVTCLYLTDYFMASLFPFYFLIFNEFCKTFYIRAGLRNNNQHN